MTPATPLAIALDVGGTKIAAATVDATGELVTPTSKVPTPAHAGAGSPRRPSCAPAAWTSPT